MSLWQYAGLVHGQRRACSGGRNKVDNDTHIYAHYPGRLKVGGKLSEDMGQRIRRPSAFQGLTKKEART
eukprot:12436795-Heterocapsa_arctica.AAC.1